MSLNIDSVNEVDGKKVFVIDDAFDDDESRSMGIHTFEFDESDIVRSELTKFIVTKVNQIPL